MEIRIPHKMKKYEFIADLEGAGRWRGGPGVHWEAVNEGSPAGMATGSSDGDEMLGHGALGGDPSPPCRTYIVEGEERLRVKPHRMAQWPTGATVLKLSSGGGGVGLPSQREPASLGRARLRLHGVELDRPREAGRGAVRTADRPTHGSADERRPAVLHRARRLADPRRRRPARQP